ncbi:MAG: ATP synthase F1 subunit gamma [Lachnospiraceae bacterium]|nr:ATP synthase F1 subunit gamma [Lachnospiraceae bacterium]
MGFDTKALRSRIKSVNSTLHLTKAMGLVASSKIRKANEAMFSARQFLDAYQETIRVLTASSECRKSPYMAKRTGGKTRIIVIAGDRGMAGGYNANVFRLARNFPGAELIPIGKRACDRFSLDYTYGIDTLSSEHFDGTKAAQLARNLCRDFAEGKFDRLGIIYTVYESIMTQTATMDWILPLEAEEGVKAHGTIFEPDENTVFQAVVPDYVAGRIAARVKESYASEVAARRTAMDSAGKNATAMLDDLSLQYNRARQGAITQEITEIVAGAGAE